MSEDPGLVVYFPARRCRTVRLAHDFRDLTAGLQMNVLVLLHYYYRRVRLIVRCPTAFGGRHGRITPAAVAWLGVLHSSCRPPLLPGRRLIVVLAACTSTLTIARASGVTLWQHYSNGAAALLFKVYRECFCCGVPVHTGGTPLPKGKFRLTLRVTGDGA